MLSAKRNPLIFPVYVPSFLLAFCAGLLIPILPIFAKSFQISYGLVGLVLAAEGIGRLAGDLPSIVIIRRLGRKTAMVSGVSCVALSTLLLYWSPSIVQVIGLRFVAGLGGSLWNISRHAYITDVTAVYQRGRAIAVFGGVNRIGMFAGPVVGGTLATFYGLRTPFLLSAGVSFLAALVAALVIERSEKAEEPLPRSHLGHLVNTFRVHYRNLVTAGSGQLFAQTIRAARQTIVPLYGADILGLDEQAVGLIVSISGFVDMSMFYPAGLIMDRLGRKFATVPCFATQAVGMGLIPFTGSFAGLLLATCIIGLGNGLGSGTMMTLGADLAPKTATGEFLGVWRLIGDGGHMAGPMAVGSLADLLNLSAPPFFIAGIGLLSAGIFAFLVPETLRKCST